MTKKLFLLLLFDYVLLSVIGPNLFCSSLMASSLLNITNYNPLVELKLFKAGDRLNSVQLDERKKGHYKSSEGPKSDDPMAVHESRAKQYLTINEIPDTAHSAYASVVHRGSQVMINPLLAKKVGMFKVASSLCLIIIIIIIINTVYCHRQTFCVCSLCVCVCSL